MFKWYYMAGICYAYIGDVDLCDEVHSEHSEQDDTPIKPFVDSRWFARSWTLQGLIAPHFVVFVDTHWQETGTRQPLAAEIVSITGIPD
jgi:hypothetical protein